MKVKMRLKRVTIHKFKCFEADQAFDVDEHVTVLVGMNESGKTAILEAIAKTHYFEDDTDFEFDATHDYPRKEKKRTERSGRTQDAVTSTFKLSPGFVAEINQDLGADALTTTEVSITSGYDGTPRFSALNVDLNKILSSAHQDLPRLLHGLQTKDEVANVAEEVEDPEVKAAIHGVTHIYENGWGWNNPADSYVAEKSLLPNRPKFLYYDEYYALPSRINIEKLQADQLESGALKTAKAPVRTRRYKCGRTDQLQ